MFFISIDIVGWVVCFSYCTVHLLLLLSKAFQYIGASLLKYSSFAGKVDSWHNILKHFQLSLGSVLLLRFA